MSKDLRENIRRDLLDQLDRRGLVDSFYVDKVDDYMSLWDTKNLLLEDIYKRGVTVEWNSNMKKNDSVGEVNKVVLTMQNMLNWLNLRPPVGEVVDGDDEM